MVPSKPQEKLVYSGHIYHYWASEGDSYEKFSRRFERTQTFVSEAGKQYSAPFLLGETGTGDDNGNWDNIIRYLRENDLDWAYLGLDGYKYGLNHDIKVTQLASIRTFQTNGERRYR